MTESKINLTHRLQREGRWDEASRFKDEKISELRAAGKNRKEAQLAAWEALEQQFPPLESETPGDEDETYPTDLVGMEVTCSSDFHSDAKWVYQHMAVVEVKPEDAPTPGAWALLKWAKRNEDRFFEQVMPKANAVKQSQDPFSGESDGPFPAAAVSSLAPATFIAIPRSTTIANHPSTIWRTKAKSGWPTTMMTTAIWLSPPNCFAEPSMFRTP